MNLKEIILKELGISPEEAADLTDEQLAEKYAAHLEAQRKPPADPKLETVPLSAADLINITKPLTERIAAVEDALRDSRTQRALDAAKAQGKVITLSASVLAKMSPEELDAHIEATPITVPLSAHTPNYVPEGGATATDAGILAKYEQMPAGAEKDAYLSANALAINNARNAQNK